jgi:predicted CXXCH cytochrome family protein
VEDAVEGAPWLTHGEFAHRPHRGVECESCHAQARASTKTADVLIPAMKACTGCHGNSGTHLDRCATCHLYHNRSLEKAPPGRMRELLGMEARP